MFFKNLLLLTLSGAVLTVVLGIWNASLIKSDRAFEFGPTINTVNRALQGLKSSWDKRYSEEANPKPFAGVVSDAAKTAVKGVQQAVPAGSTQDDRLTYCPARTIDPPNAKPVPADKATLVYQQVKQGVSFKNLAEVQMILGVNGPACNWNRGSTTLHRYLGQGMQIIDAVEDNSARTVTVSFANF